MSDATMRFQLPFILPGQAQKEMFHNEALVRIDAVLHAAVEDAAVDQPPDSPAEGQCWLVGTAPSEEWEGLPDHLALWTGGGWRFVGPRPGMHVWDASRSLTLRWNGAVWSGEVAAESLSIGGLQVVGPRQPAVPSPSGGTVIDSEARAAVETLIAALMSHGLIE